MADTPNLDETVPVQRMVSYRCSCGGDVRLPAGGEGVCHDCRRHISLRELDANQTVSFCSEIDSGASFHLTEGADRSGEELGHFRLLSKLGYGGMGAVYRALDESLQRFVAVKVMRSSEEGGTSDAKQVTRLLDEAVSQARLNHPNVVTIYYVGRKGEEPFFAMELLPGPTLATLIQDDPLPYAAVLHYAQQVVGALRHASSQGLVHGDIKPSNLILADDRTVKLGDFGLAKTERTLPTQGISGTLSYMAPEMSGGIDPTDQSDMYSLGVTLFELTFGRRPYAIVGSTLKEQLHSHRGIEVEFPERWPKTVPEQWKGLLQTLLAKDPADRYPDYTTFEQDLQQLAPVGVTNAGLLNRGLALFVDLAFWGLLLAIFWLPAVFADEIRNQIGNISRGDETVAYYLDLLASRLSLISLLAPAVPLLATWLEWRGWRSLGRYLFQLRVVDPHGLRIRSRTRLIRSVIRYISLYGGSLTIFSIALGWDLIAVFLSPIDEIVLLINMIPVLGPRRMALHDRLLGTHVVLDTLSNRVASAQK